jgi:hypothetical protein
MIGLRTGSLRSWAEAAVLWPERVRHVQAIQALQATDCSGAVIAEVPVTKSTFPLLPMVRNG